jgi:adenosylcobinamide-phosphate synthase
MVSLSIVLALLADRVFGEVRRFHPLVGFGRLAGRVETRLRRWLHAPDGAADSTAAAVLQFLAGSLAWALLIIPPTYFLVVLHSALNTLVAMLLDVIVLYFCIGARSLREHAQSMARRLYEGDLERARSQLSRVVSRDTALLDRQSVIKATIESVLQNGSDAVLAPLFWFAVAGAPGVLCYRLCSTLDTMWGYRSNRYLFFGRVAARVDDLLNWLPARCCALSYALAGEVWVALRCWHSQAPMWDSPNTGPVIAAGAGALRVQLGGPATYEGELRRLPILGEGVQPELKDINAALSLVRRALGIWLVVIVTVEALAWFFKLPLLLAMFWASLWA